MTEEYSGGKKPDEEVLSSGDALKLDLYFWLQALVMALVTLILLFTFVGRIIGVDGTSMVPTLHHQDMLILRSLAYQPEQNDIVVLTKESFMDQPVVKRIIAMGGQTVDIDYDTNSVYVDGVELDEPYINEWMEYPGSYSATHIEVPEGSVFVMGDNRNNSTDSRDPRLDVVDEGYILGQAICIMFPFSNMGLLV